ncbi:hypothetical protein AAG570_010365 [Ranatra chinensis]|uniref:Protein takeout n=1 Tax=Ranatra chinensis TaxID=642074 RepID=A0ABD0YMB3_9HEMI
MFTHIFYFRIDLKKQHLDLDISIPKLNIQGKYEVSGNVLVLAINGKGDANLTIDSINLKIGLDWEDKQKKGNLHSHITGYKVDFTVARLYIYFDNLFNGDKLLGENMNTFLNENWEAVLTDFRPAIGQTVGETVKLILNNIFEIIPFDMLFPEK